MELWLGRVNVGKASIGLCFVNDVKDPKVADGGQSSPFQSEEMPSELSGYGTL